jgi:hypothetical protein
MIIEIFNQILKKINAIPNININIKFGFMI